MDEDDWDKWIDLLHRRTTLTSVVRTKEKVRYRLNTDSGESLNVSFKYSDYTVIGLDIVAYSSRNDIGRLYLTSLLFAAILRTRRLFEKRAWQLPKATISSGDGAFVVFETNEAALAFVFAIQLFIDGTNRGFLGGVSRDLQIQADPKVEIGARILPCEVRYSLVRDKLAAIRDIGPQANYVGEGLVKCARVLAYSRGAHFLIDSEVMLWALESGGINNLPSSGAANWGQRLHIARLQSRAIKGASYEVWNAFGTFRPAHLFGSDDEAYSDGPPECPIGSHDLTALV